MRVDIPRPERRQTPTQEIEAALAGFSVIADDRQRVRRRDVPAGREVRRRTMRWDRENELDLTHIGREMGAATHGGSLRYLRLRPKAPPNTGRSRSPTW